MLQVKCPGCGMIHDASAYPPGSAITCFVCRTVIPAVATPSATKPTAQHPTPANQPAPQQTAPRQSPPRQAAVSNVASPIPMPPNVSPTSYPPAPGHSPANPPSAASMLPPAMTPPAQVANHLPSHLPSHLPNHLPSHLAGHLTSQVTTPSAPAAGQLGHAQPFAPTAGNAPVSGTAPVTAVPGTAVSNSAAPVAMATIIPAHLQAAPGARAAIPTAQPVMVAQVPKHLLAQSAVAVPVGPSFSADGTAKGRKGNQSLIYAGILCVTAALVVGVVAVTGGFSSGEKKKKEQTVQQDTEQPESEEQVTWIPIVMKNGKRDTIAYNGRRVSVERVEWGEIRGKLATHVVQVSDKPYLAIYLMVQNLNRASPLKYTSWYGNTFPSRGYKVQATMKDDAGRKYEPIRFKDISWLKGHTPSATLDYGKDVSDIIVFVVPERIDPKTIKYFHLALPAEAVGEFGTYRYEIPADYVLNFTKETESPLINDELREKMRMDLPTP